MNVSLPTNQLTPIGQINNRRMLMVILYDMPTNFALSFQLYIIHNHVVFAIIYTSDYYL